MVAACLAVVGASLLLTPGSTPAGLRLFGHELPSTCTLKATLGVPCWACGMTRAFVHGARLRLAEAWAFNPAGLMLFLLAAAQLPYRLLLIARPRSRRLPLWAQLAPVALSLLVMLVVWGLRLGGHFPLP